MPVGVNPVTPPPIVAVSYADDPVVVPDWATTVLEWTTIGVIGAWVAIRLL